MKHKILLTTLLVLLTGSLMGQAPTIVDAITLKAEFEKQQSAGLTTLNQKTVQEAQNLIKPYMQQQDAESANRAQEWVQKLSDTDWQNETTVAPAKGLASDPLTALMRRYSETRTKGLETLKARHILIAQNLQRKATSSGDLQAFNALASLIEVWNGGSGSGVVKPVTSLASLGKGEEALSTPNAKKWEIQNGNWTNQNGLLTGEGDSSIAYELKKATPFRIEFEIKVLEGMRPRVKIGRLNFANEGYESTFALYPPGIPVTKYEKNKSYFISIDVEKKKSTLFIDGTQVCEGNGVDEKIDKLIFSAGDGYSKGKVEYRDIRIGR